MHPGFALLGVLLVAALSVFAVMALRIVPVIREAAGGRKLFDERVGGYTHEEARTLLGALTPEGTRTYLRLATTWDMAFPLLYGAAGLMAIRLATPEAFPVPAGAVALIALPAVVCDLRENVLVAGMLRAGPDTLTPEAAARASFWTQWKWRTLALAAAVLVLLIGIRIADGMNAGQQP